MVGVEEEENCTLLRLGKLSKLKLGGIFSFCRDVVEGQVHLIIVIGFMSV
jgi:hypothetical protein